MLLRANLETALGGSNAGFDPDDAFKEYNAKV